MVKIGHEILHLILKVSIKYDSFIMHGINAKGSNGVTM